MSTGPVTLGSVPARSAPVATSYDAMKPSCATNSACATGPPVCGLPPLSPQAATSRANDALAATEKLVLVPIMFSLR